MNLLQLPEEIMQRILHEVSHRDLCRVASTSSKLYLSATTPTLWVRCPIDEDQVRRNGITTLDTVSRFSKLAKLSLCSSSLSAAQYGLVCSYVIESKSIEVLQLDHCDLTGVNKVILANMTVKLKKGTFQGCLLQNDQKVAIFRRILSSSDHPLVDLDLTGIDLSQINPVLVGEAVCCIKKINLSSTYLTGDQKIQIFKSNLSPTSKLSVLILYIVNLSQIDPSLLGSSLSRLSIVDLRHMNLLGTQKTAIISHIISSSVSELNLFSVTTLSSTTGLLGKAVAHVPKVDLSHTALSPSLSSEILSEISISSNILDLSLHGVNLSKCPPELVGRAVNKLFKADLSNTDLSEPQLSCLFTFMLAGTRLRKLCLSNVDMSRVNPDLLAKAVSLMSRVDLMDTGLSGYQITALLTRCFEAGSTRIALSGDMSGVPEELVERAVNSGRIHFW